MFAIINNRCLLALPSQSVVFVPNELDDLSTYSFVAVVV